MDGQSLPVFQCDECIVSKVMFGESFEVAYTFAVGPDGGPCDVAELEGLA